MSGDQLKRLWKVPDSGSLLLCRMISKQALPMPETEMLQKSTWRILDLGSINLIRDSIVYTWLTKDNILSMALEQWEFWDILSWLQSRNWREDLALFDTWDNLDTNPDKSGPSGFVCMKLGVCLWWIGLRWLQSLHELISCHSSLFSA